MYTSPTGGYPSHRAEQSEGGDDKAKMTGRETEKHGNRHCYSSLGTDPETRRPGRLVCLESKRNPNRGM